MDLKSGAIIGSTFLRFVEQFVVDIGADVGINLGVRLGPKIGRRGAKRRQDEPNKDIKSLSVPKNNIYNKCDFSMQKRILSSLGCSQDDQKRLRKAPKTTPEELQNFEKGCEH